MYGQVIEPPNTKDIPCAAIKSYLQTPTIQTRQTRDNNITVKKMWQKKSLAKIQSDTLRRQELQKSQCMQSTIDSRTAFRDMASKLKATINQETEICDNVLPLQSNITQKQQGRWQLKR
jgi:O6-methylguanine-DNA--protein-cysteine methyltransferase